jgi:hypothetical protein
MMFRPDAHRTFTPVRAKTLRATTGASSMLDILLAALGAGGILAMAAYAALCDRI